MKFGSVSAMLVDYDGPTQMSPVCLCASNPLISSATLVLLLGHGRCAAET